VRSLGLFKRREIWIPTLRGWLLIAIAVALLAAASVLTVVPFLETDRPLHQGVLIVEGWQPDYALAEAKAIFERHSYQLVLVTGVPLTHGSHFLNEPTYAHLGARTLLALGLPEESVAVAASPEVIKDRTYATALRAKAWLDQNARQTPIDVFTHGVHARRTWLLYRMVLGPHYEIGIISGEDSRYDRRNWWKTSSGFRVVSGEFVAFCYAKFLFFPPPPEPAESTR
jgi:hypothetical protein